MNVFFIYFHNVDSRNEIVGEKINWLLAHLDKEAFQFYFDRFTRDGEMVDNAKNYKNVTAVFLESYREKEDPSMIIQATLHARLDISNFFWISFHNCKTAKFLMLQKAMSKKKQLLRMALFCSVGGFASLKEVIQDFEKGLRVYSDIGSSQITYMRNQRTL